MLAAFRKGGEGVVYKVRYHFGLHMGRKPSGEVPSGVPARQRGCLGSEHGAGAENKIFKSKLFLRRNSQLSKSPRK